MGQKHESYGRSQNTGHVCRAYASFRSGRYAAERLNQRRSGEYARPDASVSAFGDAAHEGQHEQDGKRGKRKGMYLAFRSVQCVRRGTQRRGKPQPGQAVQPYDDFSALFQPGQGVQTVIVGRDLTRNPFVPGTFPDLWRAWNLIAEIKSRLLPARSQFRIRQPLQRKTQPERSGLSGKTAHIQRYKGGVVVFPGDIVERQFPGRIEHAQHVLSDSDAAARRHERRLNDSSGGLLRRIGQSDISVFSVGRSPET